MKTNNHGTKQNIVRLVAMLLIVVGVLTALPASAFAGWTYKVFNRNAVANQNITGAQGASTVQLKYFADGVYAEPAGTVKYNYYQYDPTAASTYYIAQSNSQNVVLESGSTSNALSTTYVEQLTSHAVTLGTPTFTAPGEQTSAAYCTCSGGIKKCSHEGITPSVSFAFSGYSMPTYKLGDFERTDLFMDLAPTYNNVNAYTIRESSSSAEVMNQSVTSIIDLDNGMELIATINYVITITAKGSGTVSAGTCGVKHWYIGSACTSAVNKYKATASIAVSATYTAYIRETTADYPAVWNKGLTQIKNAGDTEGVMYTIEGLSSTDIVTLPPYETLKDLIPTVVPSTKEGDPRDLYENLLYPIGYYTDVDIKNNSRGTAVKFPLTNLPAGTTTVWIEWGVKNPNTESKTDANLAIGSATSGTVNIYAKDQAASGYHTIKTDIAYLSGSNSFGLYSSIAKGVTLNLCMNDYGVTNINALSTSTPTSSENLHTDGGGTATYKDKTPALDAGNPLDYTVSLQADISVSGAIYVGGYTGVYSNANTTAHCFIVKNYVALDLNGHTLTVKNEGVLHSFGYIYDSVGTGKIIVETGGTICVPLLVYGMGGLSEIMKLYDMGSCPFVDYNLMYTNVTIDIIADENGTGNMYGFTMMYPSASLNQFFNYYMPMFGPEPQNTTDAQPLFSISQRTAGADGYVRLTAEFLESLSQYPTLVDKGYNCKSVFTFFNLDVVFRAPLLSLTVSGQQVDLDMRKVTFPISPMIDLTCVNSTFTMGQKVMAMPGCTLTFDANSVLRFNTDTFNAETDGRVEFKKVSLIIQSGTAAVTKRLVGGLYVPAYNIQNSQVFAGTPYLNGMGFGAATDFWNHFSTASVNIYGVVEFQTGVADPYVLSGNINISSFRTCDANGNVSDPFLVKDANGTVTGVKNKNWSTANLNATNLANVKLNTYGAIFVPAKSTSTNGVSNQHSAKIKHYYALPLISNGTAYLLNAENVATVPATAGTYDVDTGVFTDSSGATYILQTAISLPAEGKTGEISLNASAVSATVVQEVATTSSGTYVYYCGMYIPATTTVTDGSVTACTVTTKTSFNTAATATQSLKWSSANSRWE